MFFLRRLAAWFGRKKEIQEREDGEEQRRSFFLYIRKTPEIVTYLRREKELRAKSWS